MSPTCYPIGLDYPALPEAGAARIVRRVWHSVEHEAASSAMPEHDVGRTSRRPIRTLKCVVFFRPGAIGPTLTDTIMSVPNGSSMVSYSIHWVYYGYA